MAVYKSVTWQTGDEVTSAKLNDMAQNEQWLKDTMIQGNLNVIPSVLGVVPKGYNAGTTPILRVEPVVFHFDSQVAVTYLDIVVNIPQKFKNLPAAIVSLHTNQFAGSAQMMHSNGISSIGVRIYELFGVAKQLVGAVHVLYIGA